MKIKVIILTLLIIASGLFYYSITGSVIQEQTYKATYVVDGDTIEIETGQKVRLIGINTPEKFMPYNKEATEFLKSQIENKSVVLQTNGVDKYNRILAHVFLGDKHINKEILKQGLGNLYYYEKDKYYEDLEEAEQNARENQKNIWKKSPNSDCLELVELKYQEQPERCTNNEQLIIKNKCNKNIQMILKDDATHIFYEIAEPESTFTKNFSCTFNNDGDSLYAFDQEGMLLFFRY